MKRLLVLASVMVASPAWAQRFEVAPLTVAALTTAAHIDEKTPGVQELKIESGFTWGVQVAYLLSDHTAVEGQWTRQDTGITIATASTSVTLFSMNLDQFIGNLVYEFGDRSQRVRPLVFGGLGVSVMTADGLDTASKLTWDVGGGVKWWFYRNLGARFDGRYRPTQLNSSPSDYCAPFSFCQTALRTFQVGGSLLLRF